MKLDIKISLPLYKILLGLSFVIIIVFIRGISSLSEIVSAIEPNMALLAGIFMADNYYIEYRNNSIQIFYRFPLSNKFISVISRFFYNWIYLLFLIVLAYGGYMYIYRTINYASISKTVLFVNTIIVSGISALFMGSLAFTITNFTQKIWAGVSITILIWGCLNSNVSTFLPKLLQLFLLEELISQPGILVPYHLSRIIYLVLSLILLSSNIFALQQQPKFRKGRVMKNGNFN